MMRSPEIIGQKSVVFAIVAGMYHNKAARRYQKQPGSTIHVRSLKVQGGVVLVGYIFSIAFCAE